MTELETAIVMIIDVFDRYATKKGSNLTLSKGEIKTLLEKELPEIFTNAKEKDASEEILKDLDENGDSEVDFNEFIVFVATLTCLGHKRFEDMQPKK